MARLLFILMLVVAINLGISPVGAGEPFTAPDGTAYPDDVQAILTEAKAAYEAEDFRRAHTLWLPLAEAGNAEAQYRVGRLYDVGEGFARNGPEAVNWYTLASDQAHMSATHNLALMYQKGDLIPKNHSYASHLYRRNAEMGNAISAVGYGIQLLAGVGIPRDIVSGMSWLYFARDLKAASALPALEYYAPLVPEEYKRLALIRARELSDRFLPD